jgi:hypothetical protein
VAASDQFPPTAVQLILLQRCPKVQNFALTTYYLLHSTTDRLDIFQIPVEVPAVRQNPLHDRCLGHFVRQIPLAL